MRLLAAVLLVLVCSTLRAQTPGKPRPLSACSTELGPGTLTIYVPLTGDVQVEARPVPEVRLGLTVMHLIDTAGDFKTILLLVAPDATYARTQNAVDQALEGSRGLPVGTVQLRADEDNSHLKCLAGQHSIETKALHTLQRIRKPIPK